MDESKKIQDRIKDINAVENDNNERVIFICPGCDMTKNNAEKKTSCCNCRVFCRKLTKKVKIFILSAPGLTILLLSYLMIGAVAFNVLEGGRKWSQNYNFTKSTTGSHKDDKIKESVERLWKITENLNVLYKDNWTKLAGEEITHLQDYFFEELTIKNDNSAMSECHTKNYQSYRKRNPPFWNLGECFLYSLSLLTTVGSGNILPRTVWGRVFSMLYITIGFFIMLVYLAVVGDYLANPFRRFYTFISCNNATKKTASKSVTKCSVPNCNKTTTVYHDQSSSIPVWLAALVLITYITSGALTFNLIEKWTILDSWYFCFMSLVTIGFGGFTPGRMESISMIATSAYILIGMALLSMCFNLIQTDVVLFFRNLYLWSEREDAMNLLSLTRSMPS